jgi:hypothetical protein
MKGFCGLFAAVLKAVIRARHHSRHLVLAPDRNALAFAPFLGSLGLGFVSCCFGLRFQDWGVVFLWSFWVWVLCSLFALPTKMIGSAEWLRLNGIGSSCKPAGPMSRVEFAQGASSRRSISLPGLGRVELSSARARQP